MSDNNDQDRDALNKYVGDRIRDLLADPDYERIAQAIIDRTSLQRAIGPKNTPIIEEPSVIKFAMDRYEAARDDLFARHPMFSNPISTYRQALLTYPVHVTDITSAIAFDGENIFLNINWFEDRPFEEIKFTIAWMGFLISRGHHEKGQARQDEEGFSNYHWNVAANLLVNRVMIDAKAGVLPQVGAFVTSIGNELNNDTTIEEVYNLIRPKSKLELNKIMFPLQNWDNWIDYEDIRLDMLDLDKDELV